MPVYNYLAKDSTGKSRSGIVDAQSESSAVSLLRNQGLFIVSLVEKKNSIFENLLSFKGVPPNEVVTFTRQFSTMISAGLPIAKALNVLAEQTPNNSMRSVIYNCLRDIEGGVPLSTAFGRFPKIFSTTYQALTRAGEASGKLDTILKRLAETMESQRELQSKFKGALIYPAIVLITMVGVFVMMMVFVIPKLATMYESLNVDLPNSTKIMIGVSNFMATKYYIVIIVVIGIAFGFKAFKNTPFGSVFISKLLFALPIFGKISKQKELSDFTRTLSLLISSAIPIVEALNIVSKVITNSTYKVAAIEAAVFVEKGNSLSDYLRSNRVFPPLLAQMASVGEETGQLDSVLDQVADFFAGETDHAVKGLSAALEPIILIVLGGMVGLLIVSFITPIYKITSSI